jgi:hypothetical protein
MTNSFILRIKATGLPLDQVIVIGSGVLAAHGIRSARDVDLIVPESLFAELEQNISWKRGTQGSASYALEKGDAEVWTDWSTDGTGHPAYNELLPDTELIHGVRFITLEYLEKRKTERGTPKDVEDIRKIHEYRKNN